MNRLKKILPQHILLMIYNSLIMPHIQYGILCWGHKSGKLFRLQKRAMRLITDSKYNAHTEPLFKKLNCLMIDDVYSLNMLKFRYKSINETVPHYFKDMFTCTHTPHDHDTRFKHLNEFDKSNTPAGNNVCDTNFRRYFPVHLIALLKNSQLIHRQALKTTSKCIKLRPIRNSRQMSTTTKLRLYKSNYVKSFCSRGMEN